MVTTREQFYRELGERIRQARSAKRVSQQDLAVSTGLTRTSIANVEAGRQRLPVDRLFDISIALGVDAASLLPPPRHPSPGDRQTINKLLKGLSRDEREWIKNMARQTPR